VPNRCTTADCIECSRSFRSCIADRPQYDDAIRKLGDDAPGGREYHVCFGSGGNLRVSEIWDSREQLQAFGEQLMPVLSDVGIEFSAEPEIFEVHNTFKR